MVTVGITSAEYATVDFHLEVVMVIPPDKYFPTPWGTPLVENLPEKPAPSHRHDSRQPHQSPLSSVFLPPIPDEMG